jgi:hypothetical protein
LPFFPASRGISAYGLPGSRPRAGGEPKRRRAEVDPRGCPHATTQHRVCACDRRRRRNADGARTTGCARASGSPAASFIAALPTMGLATLTHTPSSRRPPSRAWERAGRRLLRSCPGRRAVARSARPVPASCIGTAWARRPRAAPHSHPDLRFRNRLAGLLADGGACVLLRATSSGEAMRPGRAAAVGADEA